MIVKEEKYEEGFVYLKMEYKEIKFVFNYMMLGDPNIGITLPSLNFMDF